MTPTFDLAYFYPRMSFLGQTILIYSSLELAEIFSPRRRMFPCRESDPGHLGEGESHVSYSLGYLADLGYTGTHKRVQILTIIFKLYIWLNYYKEECYEEALTQFLLDCTYVCTWNCICELARRLQKIQKARMR